MAAAGGRGLAGCPPSRPGAACGVGDSALQLPAPVGCDILISSLASPPPNRQAASNKNPAEKFPRGWLVLGLGTEQPCCLWGIGVWSPRLWSSQTGLERGSSCRRAPRGLRQLLEAGGEQSRERSVPVCPSPAVTHGIAMRRRRLRAGAAPLCLGSPGGPRSPLLPEPPALVLGAGTPYPECSQCCEPCCWSSVATSLR